MTGDMRPLPVITGACVASGVLGSVHAFSVYLVSVEQAFDVTRATASLPYSLALVGISIAVLFGPALYGRIAAPLLLGAALAGAALGAATAAFASNMATFLLGYGIVFGLSNGVGYGFALQVAGRATPGREGFAMGAVTAAYALGAALAAFPLAAILSRAGMQASLLALALVLLLSAPVAGGLLYASRARFTAQARATARRHPVLLLWLAYTSAVAAGLMAIGHASAIAVASGVTALWLAPALIALGNLAGSYCGGILGDRIAIARIMTGLGLWSAAALALAATNPGGPVTLAALTCVGITYGASIAVFPALIAKQYGPTDGPSVYGRVFTGWGLMGLCAPWIAGTLFETTGAYQVPLLIAAALALASAAISLRLPRSMPRH